MVELRIALSVVTTDSKVTLGARTAVCTAVENEDEDIYQINNHNNNITITITSYSFSPTVYK